MFVCEVKEGDDSHNLILELLGAGERLGAGVLLRPERGGVAQGSVAKNIFGRSRSPATLSQAAIWKSEATNFACPCASLPANLLT
jgi:hypothetical protein